MHQCGAVVSGDLELKPSDLIHTITMPSSVLTVCNCVSCVCITASQSQATKLPEFYASPYISSWDRLASVAWMELSRWVQGVLGLSVLKLWSFDSTQRRLHGSKQNNLLWLLSSAQGKPSSLLLPESILSEWELFQESQMVFFNARGFFFFF